MSTNLKAIKEPENAGSMDVSVVRQAMTSRDILERLGTKWRMIPVLIVLVAIWIYFGQQNELFLSSRNLSNLAGQIVVTSLVALGLLFVLVVGEIDLSVAAASAVSAGVAAKLSLNYGLDSSSAVALGLLTGILLGAINGLIVTVFRAPSFIVTLGISLILQGILLQLLPPTNLFSLVGNPISGLSTTYLSAGLGWMAVAIFAGGLGILKLQRYTALRALGLPSSLFWDVVIPFGLTAATASIAVMVFNSYKGVPLSVALLIIVLGFLAYLTTQTKFGLYLFAIGANPEAARRAGIPVSLVKVAAFMISGALVATGGIMAASRVMGVSPQSADPSLLLEAIAAAVIGGVSLFGGRGSVWSALTGALLIGSISNGLLLVNATTQTRLEVQGVILIIAVVVDAMISRAGAKR